MEKIDAECAITVHNKHKDCTEDCTELYCTVLYCTEDCTGCEELQSFEWPSKVHSVEINSSD